MKASRFRDMSKEDLIQEETELRRQLLRIRFQAATGQTEGAAKMKDIRRDIARIKTVLTEMERQGLR
ncbi:MAG: 50S ribosomal protein L29 [Acidobacteria bacterium]|nr:50S ribosomal protein L29 [Acidobacteriota bacterium]